MAGETLADALTGQERPHALVGLVRQSVFGRLAGYEDVNDVERLRHDPAIRWIVGGQRLTVTQHRRARWRRFETQWLAAPATSLLLPTCRASGSSSCTAPPPREVSCSTWIQA